MQNLCTRESRHAYPHSPSTTNRIVLSSFFYSSSLHRKRNFAGFCSTGNATRGHAHWLVHREPSYNVDRSPRHRIATEQKQIIPKHRNRAPARMPNNRGKSFNQMFPLLDFFRLRAEKRTKFWRAAFEWRTNLDFAGRESRSLDN